MGSVVIELHEGETYVEPGFSANCVVDGNLTSKVEVTGLLDTSFAGKYTLTYRVFNSGGFLVKATREIIVRPVEIPEVAPPEISPIGSNPIVLHLAQQGGTPYFEQGAVAYCDIDGDISHLVSVSGNVNTSVAGIYIVAYSVTNSKGVTSEVTRTVRVISATELVSRLPDGFNRSGKAGDVFNYPITVKESGSMRLTVSPSNKTSVLISIRDEFGAEVYNRMFAGSGTHDVTLKAGAHIITATIREGNGNTNYRVDLLMPETTELRFAEPEVPLVDPPSVMVVSERSNTLLFMIIGGIAIYVIGACTPAVVKGFRRRIDM
jgi:hypothetical protein